MFKKGITIEKRKKVRKELKTTVHYSLSTFTELQYMNEAILFLYITFVVTSIPLAITVIDQLKNLKKKEEQDLF